MSSHLLNLVVWLGLMGFLALTVGLSFLDLPGLAHLLTGALIAAAKTALIVMFYMEILKRGYLPRIAGITLLLFLALMFGITLEVSFRGGSG